MKAASTLDYRALAKRRLPHFLFEYIDGGSHAEVTLRRNVADLERVALRQRVLRNATQLDLTNPQDAREAVALGADGLVVSNHGGRQLDGVQSTTRALPAIVDAVGDALTVLADGGVRSGLDVVRILALGAKGVMLGRAWAYALAGAGEAGVAHLLQLIEAETRVAMTLTGVTSIAQINSDILVGWGADKERE